MSYHADCDIRKHARPKSKDRAKVVRTVADIDDSVIAFEATVSTQERFQFLACTSKVSLRHGEAGCSDLCTCLHYIRLCIHVASMLLLVLDE